MFRKQKLELEILRTAYVAPDTRLITLTLDRDLAAACLPGQFFNLQPLDSTSPLLRRPISICDARPERGELDLLVQAVGEGTRQLNQRRCGAHLDVVGPLGHAFEVDLERPALMVAGGVGVAPLYFLAAWIRRRAPKKKQTPIVFCYGARSASDFVLLHRIGAAATNVELATEDGSRGTKGYVTACAEPYFVPGSQIFVCGPPGLMNATLAILRERGLRAQLSLENQMGCGVGACQGCVVPGKQGTIRVCCDGPVVDSEEIDHVLCE